MRPIYPIQTGGAVSKRTDSLDLSSGSFIPTREQYLAATTTFSDGSAYCDCGREVEKTMFWWFHKDDKSAGGWLCQEERENEPQSSNRV